MDVTNLMSSTVTLEAVKNSPSKKAVIVNGGVMKQMQDGKNKLCILVDMDQKQVDWIPNKTSLKNMSATCGKESNAWVGKQISFEVGSVNGKDAIIAKPLEVKVEGVQ